MTAADVARSKQSAAFYVGMFYGLIVGGIVVGLVLWVT